MATKEQGAQVYNQIATYLGETGKATLPAATLTNIADLWTQLDGKINLQNEFANALVDRIGLTIVRARGLTNSLAILKQGRVPIGRHVQEIAVNPAQDHGFDPNGTGLMKRYTPDVKAAYHTRSRRAKYPVSISSEQLQEAFVSWDSFNRLISTIVGSLQSGDNLDEFSLMKWLLGQSLLDGRIHFLEIASDPTDKTAFATEVAEAMQNLNSYFQYPRVDFNGYLSMAEQQGLTDKTPFWTQSPQADIITVIRSDIKNLMGVNLFAQAFNMAQVDFKNRVIETDNFLQWPGDKAPDTLTGLEMAKLKPIAGAYGIVADRALTQVYDNQNAMEAFRNGDGLFTNYFYHRWQTYGLSPFANAVFIVKQGSIPTLPEGMKVQFSL